MARILKARYFAVEDILNVKLRKKASYTWKSILDGCDLLAKGMKFIVGDGTLVNMWTDPWIPDHPPRPPNPRGEVIPGEKVKEYFDDNCWVKIGYDEIKVRNFPRNVFFEKRKDNSQKNREAEELSQVL